jgi:thioesterase domain-containing protein
MAADYRSFIKQAQPRGPYRLGGWSLGAVVAWEIATQLAAGGEEVALLALMDPSPLRAPVHPLFNQTGNDGELLLMLMGNPPGLAADELRGLDPDRQVDRVLAFARQLHQFPPDFGDDQARRLLAVSRANLAALRGYHPKPYRGRVAFLLAKEADPVQEPWHGPRGWLELAPGPVEVHEVDGTHLTMMAPPHVEGVARRLRQCLDRPDRLPAAARNEVNAVNAARPSAVALDSPGLSK